MGSCGLKASQAEASTVEINLELGNRAQADETLGTRDSRETLLSPVTR